jgi:hypothetical protein
MSRAFDYYFRKEANDSYRREQRRLNPDLPEKVEEEKPKTRRKMVIPVKKKGLTEALPPLPGMGGGGPGGPPPAAPNSAAKNFTSIIMDAKSWLEQQKVTLGNLPPDSPEMSTVNSALGMVTEYLPQPGEGNTAIADKVALLSQKLGQMFPNGGDGEVADYIRALSGKLAEFRTTIDVTDVAPPEPAAAPEPAAPKAAPKPAPVRPSNPDALAKGLDIAAGVK